MKKLFGFTALLLLLTVAAYPQLSFKVSGGLTWVNGGDYNKGIAGLMSYINDTYTGISGEIGQLKTAMNFSGELIFNLSPQIGIGIGGGYFGLSRTDKVTFDAIGFDEEITYAPKVTAIPIFLNVHFFLQAAPKLKLDFYGGPVLVLSKLSWTDSDYWALWELDHTFESSGTVFGGQFGVGAELEIAPRFSLVLDCLYRLASWTEVKGTWTENGWVLIWNVDTTEENAYLWSYRDGGYDWVSIAADQPSGSTVTGAKKANLNLGGIVATIGFKIGF